MVMVRNQKIYKKKREKKIISNLMDKQKLNYVKNLKFNMQ